MFGLDANQLTHQNTAVENLVKTSLSERLGNCKTVRQKVSCLADFLKKQARRRGSGNNQNNQLEYALTALRQGRKLPDLRRDLNQSERSLERLFITHVGITPVMYSRIIRFQSAITLIRHGRSRSLTDIAHTLEYFDQSHFIRDFKLFSGVTPTTYVRKAIEHMPGFPEWSA
ncbi:helix-turn-helix domain-containing protein [Puia sp. P3]|uniref:helix-turn-helix domain-containing protein n=1 Tax=Puia sp. P3 TaxID=3423952 RepID=UPI003D676722